MPTVVVGGNEVDFHLNGVDLARHPARAVTTSAPPRGRPLPALRRRLDVQSGLEVGHVFKLGTKYSKAMGAHLPRREAATRPLIMGCYGIGVTRIVAAADRGPSRRERHRLAASPSPPTKC